MGERGFPVLETEEVEIAWKKLPLIFNEPKPHYHKKGVEINIVISGTCKLEIDKEVKELQKGDFLVIYPQSQLRNISTKAGTEVVVVKTPIVQNDKFEN